MDLAVNRCRGLALLVLLLGAAVSACGTVRTVQKGSALDVSARWVMLPMTNLSQTPQAAQRAAAVLETLLRARGINQLQRPPREVLGDDAVPVLDDDRAWRHAMKWAKSQRFTYGVTGSVEEWRYRGLDGKPAAGITVRVIALRDEQVLWSASGARSGWGQDTVSGVAQSLLAELLQQLPLKGK